MTKVALVTGGSRGIGAASAVALAEQGWDVALSWRESEEDALRVAADCRTYGVRATPLPCDVAFPEQIASLFAAVDTFGPLGAVVNNAGVVSHRGRVEGYDAERLDRLLGINVRAPFLVAREAVRRMSTRHGGGGGVIVNVSSRAAQLGSAGEYVDYAASKAAVDAMTVGLAAEVGAEGIRVVGVRPGLIDTDIHEPGRLERLGASPPLGRPGTAVEVAAAIAWLASPAASYVTGTSLDVGGGR